MVIGELMKLLGQYPPELEVCMGHGSAGQFWKIVAVGDSPLKWWRGRYLKASPSDPTLKPTVVISPRIPEEDQ